MSTGKTCGGRSYSEGIENNPVMFELLYELPWREERFHRMNGCKRI